MLGHQLAVIDHLQVLILKKKNSFPLKIPKKTDAMYLYNLCDVLAAKSQLSFAEAQREIGYIQGCLVAHGIVTYDAVNRLNRSGKTAKQQ